MLNKEEDAVSALNLLLAGHKKRIKDIEDYHRGRVEFFDECLKLTVGGTVVLWVVFEAFSMIARLPPYVA